MVKTVIAIAASLLFLNCAHAEQLSWFWRASNPDIKGMFGWQLQMQFFRAGEGPIGKPIAVKCLPRMVKDARDCLESGLFLTEKECLDASGPQYIDLYPKPPAGPNDWYGSVFQCVHVVGPSWAS